MRLTSVLLAKNALLPPVISLKNATFYRSSPTSNSENVLFPNTTLSLSSKKDPGESWAIVGADSVVRTDFLRALRGELFTKEPNAASFPYLATDEIAKKDPRLKQPHQAIHYVGFDADRGHANLRGSYLAQRYESKQEVEDYTVRSYLLGRTSLNVDEKLLETPADDFMSKVVTDLKLAKLLDTPVNHLSNGQTRRSKIAKALLQRPEVLMLDSPFMGLDPKTVIHLSDIFKELAETASPRIVLSLRADEHVPNWITQYILLRIDHKIHLKLKASDMKKELQSMLEKPSELQQTKAQKDGKHVSHTLASFDVDIQLREDARQLLDGLEATSPANLAREYQKVYRLAYVRRVGYAWQTRSYDDFPRIDTQAITAGEPLIQMKGVRVAYGEKMVLGRWAPEDDSKEPGLWWTVRRGQRWGVFGPNGSGKTTLTALISSDHPQSYSLPIEFFGRPRLPEAGKPGISFFDIQARIGVSSPEVHAFFPKNISVRQALESAWADTPLGKTNLSPAQDDQVAAVLLWFQEELCPELGPTPSQQAELHRPFERLIHFQSYRGKKPKPYIKERYQDRVTEFVTSNATLGWADDKTVGSLPFASQRVLLFLRAIIKRPDIVILDEAFSGMDPLTIKKCHLFLAHGDTRALRYRQYKTKKTFQPLIAHRSEIEYFGLSKFGGLSDEQALIVIAHRKEEVPGSVRNWITLPEPGEDAAPRTGSWDGPIQLDPNKWREVWDLPLHASGPLQRLKTHRGRDRKKTFERAPIQKTSYQSQERLRRIDAFTRTWNTRSRLKQLVDHSSKVVRKLDASARRIILSRGIRENQFGPHGSSQHLLARAELRYHEAARELVAVNAMLWSKAGWKVRRQEIRRASDKKPPRAIALQATRFQSVKGELGIHGF